MAIKTGTWEISVYVSSDNGRTWGLDIATEEFERLIIREKAGGSFPSATIYFKLRDQAKLVLMTEAYVWKVVITPDTAIERIGATSTMTYTFTPYAAKATYGETNSLLEVELSLISSNFRFLFDKCQCLYHGNSIDVIRKIVKDKNGLQLYENDKLSKGKSDIETHDSQVWIQSNMADAAFVGYLLAHCTLRPDKDTGMETDAANYAICADGGVRISTMRYIASAWDCMHLDTNQYKFNGVVWNNLYSNEMGGRGIYKPVVAMDRMAMTKKSYVSQSEEDALGVSNLPNVSPEFYGVAVPMGQGFMNDNVYSSNFSQSVDSHKMSLINSTNNNIAIRLIDVIYLGLLQPIDIVVEKLGNGVDNPLDGRYYITDAIIDCNSEHIVVDLIISNSGLRR